MNFRDGRRRPEAHLDMTPLIDVVFLLLIFFLITTTFAKPTQSSSGAQEGQELLTPIPIHWAEASLEGSSDQEKKRTSVFIDAQGQLFLEDGQQILPNALKKYLMEHKEEIQAVDIKADREVSYGAVIELLQWTKESGIEEVNFITLNPDAVQP